MNENNNINENKEIKDTDFVEVNNNNNEKDKKTKKKFKISKGKIIGLSILGVVLAGAITAGAVTYEIMEHRGNNPIEQAKQSMELKFAETPNYTLDQAKEIALKKVDGTVVNTKEDVDDGIVEYEIQIKDKDNMLQEITVSGQSGAITEIENATLDHNKDHHDHDKKDYNDDNHNDHIDD